MNKYFEKKKKIQISGTYFKYVYDFIIHNESILNSDFSTNFESHFPNKTNIIGPSEKLYIDPKAIVHKGSTFDTRNGAIFISEEAEIIPPSIIQGPCYIGKKVLVDSAKLRPVNSFAEGCKLSGEISDSIFLEYVNKHHDGFIGHSYIGSFVNFGAMSTNSDLKNNYSNIKIFLDDNFHDTDLIKLGIFVGDFSKFGIGSLINSGTHIGVGCNLYNSNGVFPKYIPSFSWGSKYPFEKYEIERFLKDTKTILSRRRKTLEQAEEKILIDLHKDLGAHIYEKII